MIIGKRVGIALIALALVGAWALPASAAEVPVSPAPKEVKTAAPVSKATKPRVVGHRVVRKFWRHRTIRVAAAEWPLISRCHACGSYIFLGIGF